MKLQRVRVESFRRFRQPLEIRDLAPGLNVFAAPNETGKSTVAEAIRAAFLERHRSSSVAYLRPWDQPSATPQVEVDFEWQGRRFNLVKTFLGKKRCHLLMDGRALDGAEAEDYLADLMGFRFARKGASDAGDMGVPGLLWIRQGDAQDLASRVRHAGQQLRDALSDSLGELSASDGDEILGKVREARNALLHATMGVPKGDYAAAQKQAELLRDEVAELQERIALFHGDIDKLEGLRREHAAALMQRPWEEMARQREQAQARLLEARGLAERKQQADARLRQAQAQVAAQHLRVEHLRQQAFMLEERRKTLETVRGRVQQALTALQQQESAAQQAARQRDQARVAQDAARQVQRYAEGVRQAEAAQQLVLQLEQRVRQAEAAQASWRNLDQQAQPLRLSPADLKRLLETEQVLHLANARLAAASTALEFDLEPNAQLYVEGVALSGSGRHTLVQSTLLEMPGLGSMRVIPGGTGLQSLQDEQVRLAHALQSHLQELKVVSVAAATEQARQYDQLRAQADAARQVLATIAPQGLPSLHAALHDAKEQATLAQQWLAAQPGNLAGVPVPADPTLREREFSQAQQHLDGALETLHGARLQAGVAEAEAAAAQAELTRAEAAVTTPERAAEQQQALLDLANARGEEAQAQQSLQALEAQLRHADLELLEQDVRRLADSENIQRQRHQDRERLLAELGSRLETVGSTGLEEDLADRRQRLEQAERRVADLGRRARALDYLLTHLEEARARMVRRLHAPLQKHLDRYLRILFPGASVALEDDLVPGQMTRIAGHGQESGPLDDLSHGAREQVGVLARLAYADLLQEAGRPSLVILDDALVHSDEARLGQMKRVLYDAAKRHQILVFTCHPKAWEDLGVPTLDLASVSGT